MRLRAGAATIALVLLGALALSRGEGARTDDPPAPASATERAASASPVMAPAPTASPPPPERTSAVPFRRLALTVFATIDGLNGRATARVPTVVLVTSPAEASLLLATDARDSVPTFIIKAIEEIDYERELVVALFGGIAPDSCRTVVTRDVRVGPGPARQLIVERRSPRAGEGCFQSVGPSLELIAVDRSFTIYEGATVVVSGDATAEVRWCGVHVQTHPMEPPALSVYTCRDTAPGPVQLTTSRLTVEGDPIVTTALLRPDGPSRIVRDTREDAFGQQRLWVYVCADREERPDPDGRRTYTNCVGAGERTLGP